MGIIFTTPLASIMIGAGFLGGWPSAFYVFGKMLNDTKKKNSSLVF
jgi:hypothetical protein